MTARRVTSSGALGGLLGLRLGHGHSHELVELRRADARVHRGPGRPRASSALPVAAALCLAP